MIQVASLFDRILDDFFGPRGLGKLPHGDHVRPGLDNFFDLVADLAQVDIQVLQDVGGDATALLDQAEQDVFRADVLVVEALGLLVGQLHHLAGTVGEAFIHAVDSDGFTGPVPVQNRTCSIVRLSTHPAQRTFTKKILDRSAGHASPPQTSPIPRPCGSLDPSPHELAVSTPNATGSESVARCAGDRPSPSLVSADRPAPVVIPLRGGPGPGGFPSAI